MAPVPDHVPDRDLADLHTELLGTARHRTRRREDDPEDLVQEAWLREIKSPARPGAPALRARVFRKLRDAGAERLRTLSDRERSLEALDDHHNAGAEDDLLAVFELEQSIRAIAGDDAVEEARRRVIGMTEADHAAQPGWDPQRAGRARKALEGARNYLRETLRD